jgi:hypothetical protein
MRLDIRKLELSHWAAIGLLVALVAFAISAIRTTTGAGPAPDGTATAHGTEDQVVVSGYRITSASWRTADAPESQPTRALSPAEEAELRLLENLGEQLQGIPVAVQRN